jgi:hypothetical protein
MYRMLHANLHAGKDLHSQPSYRLGDKSQEKMVIIANNISTYTLYCCPAILREASILPESARSGLTPAHSGTDADQRNLRRKWKMYMT